MYLLIKFLYAVFSRMPLWLLHIIGRTLGASMYYLLSSRRKVAYKNCELMGLSGDVKKIVKSSFKHTFCSYMEAFYVKNIDSNFVSENVEVEFKGDKPENSAFFMVSAHFGAWEILSSILPDILNAKGATVGRKIKNKKVDEFITKQRSNSKVGYIHHRNATDAIKEYMEKGEAIGVLLDHSSMPKDSMTVPFFGINTTFIKGAILLSIRKNYPFLPVFVLRKDNGYKMVVYPLMYPDTNLKPKDRSYDLALRINKVFEEVILENPDQWYLIHKRFKRVANENGEYIKDIY